MLVHDYIHPKVREHLVHYTTVFAVVSIYFASATMTITTDRYPVIGDERPFYEMALRIIEEGLPRPFQQDGVYGFNPVLGSAYQAGIILLIGGEVGWKMSCVIMVGIAGVGMYILGTQLRNRRTGLAAITLFLSSHYLFSLAHIGYNNQDALAPVIWSLVLFIRGTKDGNPMWFALAGLVMAWGLYTHYGARLAVPMCMAATVLMMPVRSWIRSWPAWNFLGVGALAAFLDGHNSIATWNRILGGSSREYSGDVGDRMLWNWTYNTKALFHNTRTNHHIHSALVDPITLALSAIGVWSVPILILFWLFLSWFASAILAPHMYEATSRLFIMMPPICLLGAFGVDILLSKMPRVIENRGLPVLLFAVAWLNIYMHVHEVL